MYSLYYLFSDLELFHYTRVCSHDLGYRCVARVYVHGVYAHARRRTGDGGR